MDPFVEAGHVSGRCAIQVLSKPYLVFWLAGLVFCATCVFWSLKPLQMPQNICTITPRAYGNAGRPGIRVCSRHVGRILSFSLSLYIVNPIR